MFDTGRGNIDPFFPDAREDGLRIPIQVLRESLKYTRQLCAECPVKRECFEFAIQFDEHYGIWGGVCFERRFHDKTRMRIA